MPDKPRKVAEGTKIEAAKPRREIEGLLKKHGATSLIYGEQNDVGRLMFAMRGRHLRFNLKLVDPNKQAGEHRRRWRALLLVLKGKLESMQYNTIETFEEAFLAHTMTPDGSTVGEAMLPRLADAYKTGRQPDMTLALPAPSSDPRRY